MNNHREYKNANSWDKLYDWKWKQYREKYLKVNARCYACGKTAQEVDHLIPHKGDSVLFKRLNNHIPLCESCHSSVTNLFDRRYTPGNSIEPKVQWLNAKRVINDLHFAVKVMPGYP